MKLFSFLSVLATMSLAAPSLWATDDLYINQGNADYRQTEAPQIDARNFINTGYFDVITLIPFDTQGTLNFTNRGTMRGSVGYEFDLASTTDARRPMANWVNLRGASVEAYEGVSYYASNTLYYPTFITVWATNIVNEGSLTVANAGLLQLTGHNINLSRGGLEVGSLTPDLAAGPAFPEGNFVPDAAVYDYWWGTGIQPPGPNYPVPDTSQMVRVFGNQFQAVSPLHEVSNNFASGFVQVGSFPAFPFGYTNMVGGYGLTLTNADGTTTNVYVPTNIMRQAVFVGLSDTNNFSIRTKFFPSTLPGVAFNTVAVELRLANTNLVTDTGETNALYVLDRLASETNLALWTNIVVYPETYRPASHEVYRTAPFEFILGRNGNALVDKNFVWNQSFSNRFVTNYYAGYAAYVDYLSVRPPVVPGLEPLDQPGRIEVVGTNVNLTKTRFRGMGIVSVEAEHLISSAQAAVDAPNLIYNLGSTNGLLTVQSLARESTLRMAGQLELYSGLWTNQTAMILSNWFIDANTNYFNPVTNAIDVGIHLFIVSADFLNATQTVVVHDLIARSTNIVVDDPVLVSRRLILKGDSFTLNGKLTLTNDLMNFRYTNVEPVRFFTNAGILSVPNQANYSFDRERRFETFVNRGTLNAFSHNIAGDYFENRGVINSDNNLTVVAGTVTLEGGRETTRGATTLAADNVRLQNYTISSDAGYFLSVTNSLTDSGGGANNQITVQDGFHLLRKPTQGDLLGTTFETSAAKFASVTHSWAAEDRGAAAAGFEDNAAIGRLALGVSPGGELRFIKPADLLGNPLEGDYALYVDYLELEDALQADPEAAMVIDPGMRIYFATANVPVESLDGKFDGNMRWVKEYAGPSSGSSVAVRMGGTVVKTIRVNTALLNSQLIDSDADGLANAYDNWPFDGPMFSEIQVTGTNPAKVTLTWEGAAGTTYRLESTPTLEPADWREVAAVTNTATVTAPLTFTDSVTGTGREQYYRIRYDP